MRSGGGKGGNRMIELYELLSWALFTTAAGSVIYLVYLVIDTHNMVRKLAKDIAAAKSTDEETGHEE
jgi:hypothetical protein